MRLTSSNQGAETTKFQLDLPPKLLLCNIACRRELSLRISAFYYSRRIRETQTTERCDPYAGFGALSPTGTTHPPKSKGRHCCGHEPQSVVNFFHASIRTLTNSATSTVMNLDVPFKMREHT